MRFGLLINCALHSFDRFWLHWHHNISFSWEKWQESLNTSPLFAKKKRFNLEKS